MMRSSISFFAIVFLCTSSAPAGELLRTHRCGTPNDSHEGAWAGHIEYAAWLDDDHIMYALPAAESGSAETNTWVLDVDGKEPPRLLVPRAYSAVVWRPSAESPG